ncbi:MAG: KOW motif-containing protein [Bacteroidales bacterium]|nr:KOW motif-containing protein [Bacteroidales bacterium]
MAENQKTTTELNDEEVQRLLREKRYNALRWYVLYVTAQHERQILEAFTGKPDAYRPARKSRSGASLAKKLPVLDPPIEAYVPMREERHKWSDRTRIVPICLAPGIIFVRIRLKDKARLYISDHIRKFLYRKDLREPASISDATMEAFKSIIEKSSDSSMQAPEPGDTVQVLSGPFEGFQGEIVRRDGATHFQLRIFEGCAVTVRMDANMMKVVPKGTQRVFPDAKF